MTDQEQEKILKWIGFFIEMTTDGHFHWFAANKKIASPTDNKGIPILDLNFFFEYCVPKLNNLGRALNLMQAHKYWKAQFWDWNFNPFKPEGRFEFFPLTEHNSNPTEACYKALLKLIEGEK